ncbi:hypothetical protein MPS_4180 [Mycobacterium pseudoshottsii JCM 15466]|nr:Aldehyde dehydrogenase [Mycobacterium pseudoshottsii]GAQ38482.1 hypothetical protein MPS_4180 [Mycobacterium pseudoshottsii JCM 15466]
MGEKTEYDKLFIGGRWTEPSTSEVIEVHCPATGEYVGKVPLAAAADVDAAVAAARAAFDNGPWPSTPPKERATVIANALKLLEERKDHFAKLLADETGQPPMTVETMHWMGSIGALNFFAGPAVDQVRWKEIRNGSYGQTIVHREPIGVVGAIVAWNVPLFLAINKLGPALLAGCTVVLKPAAETPLTANALAEVFAEAGLPEGVLSVVPGGVETGQALTSNPGVDLFTFTGSSAVGKEIGRRAAEMLKPCTLELGGKSAAILLEDVDLSTAVPIDGLLRDHEHRAGLRGPDPHPGPPVPLRGDRGGGKRLRTSTTGRAAVGPSRPNRVADLGEAAGQGRGLHRQGHRGRRPAGFRRRPPGGSGQRILRAAHRLRRRRQQDDDRARGDLRAGAGGDPL